MSKSKATRAEKHHMAIVKTMPCVICYPAWFDSRISLDNYYEGRPACQSEYDHLVDGYRLGHFFGIPLCTNHHLAKKGYMSGYEWDSSKPNQWKLLEKVYKILDKDIPEYNPKGRNNFKSNEKS